MTAVDLEAIVSDEMRQAPTAFELESFDVEASNVRAPLARVRVRLPGGEVESGSFTGDGPVDAFFSAINAAVGHDARLREFHVSAVTGGRDALGEVTVLLELDGALASGVGVSTDILEASGKAYLRALSHGARQGRAGLGRLGGRGGRGASRARAALDSHTLTMADFIWRDGERLDPLPPRRARGGGRPDRGAGFSDYALLTTERAAVAAPALVAAADGVVHVPPGKVDEVSAAPARGRGGSRRGGPGRRSRDRHRQGDRRGVRAALRGAPDHAVGRGDDAVPPHCRRGWRALGSSGRRSSSRIPT